MNQHDYHLTAANPAIDAGENIAEVSDDYDGNPRQPGSYDVGAFEYQTTGLGNQGSNSIKKFYLYPNYPNPFNPETAVSYQLPLAGEVELIIYNSLGQKVRTLVEARKPAGQHEVTWNGRDDRGQAVGSGIYYVQLRAQNSIQTRKMLLLR